MYLQYLILIVGPIMCPELSRVENGTLQLSSGTLGRQLLGTSAKYICNTGFVMDDGASVRICSSNGASTEGVWTGIAPNCLSRFIIVTSTTIVFLYHNH